MASQKQIVIDRLKGDGYITRNWCLQHYISRLSAIIYDLKKEKWEFTEIRDGGNYIYRLTAKPEKVINYTEETRKAFTHIRPVNKQTSLF